MPKGLDQLYRKIGYQFNDEQLVKMALTHRSVTKNNNERLEFLGDAVLGLVIAEELYKKFPDTKEGELSRLRANLVKGETLCEVAREFQLGDFLNLGIGELKSGGFDRDSILADAFEAIMGAIYLDADLNICKERILSWFEERLGDPTIFKKLKDPKTELQEYLQGHKMPLPEYKIVSAEGEPHEQIFTISCKVKGVSYESQDSDTTRRRAEQKAAQLFLAWLEQDDGL